MVPQAFHELFPSSVQALFDQLEKLSLAASNYPRRASKKVSCTQDNGWLNVRKSGTVIGENDVMDIFKKLSSVRNERCPSNYRESSVGSFRRYHPAAANMLLDLITGKLATE